MDRKEIDYAMEMLERGFVPLVRERNDLQKVFEQEQESALKIPTGKIIEMTKRVSDDSNFLIEYSALLVWFNCQNKSTDELSGFEQLQNLEVLEYSLPYHDKNQLTLFF
ncbi:MAG: hypothetical protein AABX91_00445 [Nanoarchaeota archaeon]